MQQTILITGGAGYIGSHAVYAFLEAGWRVVVLDNLSTGIRANTASEAVFVHQELGDVQGIDAILRQYKPRAIVHFAGSIVVPESVAQPLKYYQNNTVITRQLLELAVQHEVEAFLFSSTAAVYGEPAQIPVREDAPLLPINPYGFSKLASEYMVRDCGTAYGLKYGILRYFNVAGADPKGRTGQSTPAATHLIKVACEVATGQRPQLSIYGDDYPTPDGTCVRDYIHVSDLADAHVATLEYALSDRGNVVLNCGYGRGYSVREVVRALEAVTGKALPVVQAGRRAGDPASLIADNTRILQTLDWRPRHADLTTIVRTALHWEEQRLREAA